MQRLTFDVYGRFLVHVERDRDGWRVLRVGPDGKRGALGVHVPPDVQESQLAEFLDDLLHETAGPGDAITRIDP